MKESEYFTLKHIGTLGDKPFWFSVVCQYYGIDRSNHFSDLDDAKNVLNAIIDKSGYPADEYRIVHVVTTEEVVA